jgi:hypothetical protein
VVKPNGRLIVGIYTKGETTRRKVQEYHVEFADLRSEVIAINLPKEMLVLTALTTIVSLIAGAGVMYFLPH